MKPPSTYRGPRSCPIPDYYIETTTMLDGTRAAVPMGTHPYYLLREKVRAAIFDCGIPHMSMGDRDKLADKIMEIL